MERHFRIEAMAYEPILQATLDMLKQHGFLTGTYGTENHIGAGKVGWNMTKYKETFSVR
mgnify:CR=1 FL=1